MSFLATLILAWAATYAYVAWYCHALYRRQRTKREYLAFSFLSLSMAFYAIAGAYHHDARNVATAALALRAQIVAAIVAVGWYVDFAHVLVGRHLVWPARTAHTLSALTVMLALTGLLVDPHIPHLERLWSWPWAASYALVRPLPANYIIVSACVILAAQATYQMARQHASHNVPSGIAVAGAVCLPTGIHDLLLHAVPFGSVQLLPHAFLLVALSMGAMLLQRFLQTQRTLQAHTAALDDDTKNLQQMRTELIRQQQLAAVGELSSIIANELRAPLDLAIGAVNRLQQTDVTDDGRRAGLDTVDEETDRLNRLVRDLLTYSRPMTPFPQAVALLPLVSRCLAGIRERCAGTDAWRIEVDVAAHQMVDADPELLCQALLNLLNNALDAMPDGGCLRVRATSIEHAHQPSACCISVIDTGTGMSGEVLRRARDPFYTTNASSTGLGLAIVERVVTVHGGRVDIESSPQEGTTVSMMLPHQRPGILALGGATSSVVPVE